MISVKGKSYSLISAG